MKLLPLITLLLFPLLAQAGYKLPKGVFTMDQLDAAKAKAAENKSPIVWVLTDKTTS